MVVILEDDRIKFEVVNTKNVKNRALEIDADEASHSHNRTICRYLQDEGAYRDYLYPKLQEQFMANMRIIDTTVHEDTIRATAKSLCECVKRKFRRQPDRPDNRLKRVFSHDLSRYIMLRMIK